MKTHCEKCGEPVNSVGKCSVGCDDKPKQPPDLPMMPQQFLKRSADFCRRFTFVSVKWEMRDEAGTLILSHEARSFINQSDAEPLPDWVRDYEWVRTWP